MREDIKKRIIEKDETVVERIEFIEGHPSIDICVIPKGDIELKELYNWILYVPADERYDITVFNEIPWYLRGEILEHNEVI